MTPEWLEEYLKDSIARNICTKIHCTTCRSHEFRGGLQARLGSNIGGGRLRGYERKEALALVWALAGIQRPDISPGACEEAVRFIIMDIWTGMPFLDQEIESHMGNSWAGTVLQRMKEHYHQRLLALEAISPEKMKERRDEEKKQRQKAHLVRLAEKSKRDIDWQANHPELPWTAKGRVE